MAEGGSMEEVVKTEVGEDTSCVIIMTCHLLCY